MSASGGYPTRQALGHILAATHRIGCHTYKRGTYDQQDPHSGRARAGDGSVRRIRARHRVTLNRSHYSASACRRKAAAPGTYEVRLTDEFLPPNQVSRPMRCESWSSERRLVARDAAEALPTEGSVVGTSGRADSSKPRLEMLKVRVRSRLCGTDGMRYSSICRWRDRTWP
jgi:hypothetical protein